jgi:CheY-like chemotaxis protein
MSVTERGYQLLLVEPSSVVRSIIVSVVRQQGLAQVHQTSHFSTANDWLIARSFDGILMSVDDSSASMELLTLVRMGQFRCDPTIPVVALVYPEEQRLVKQLAGLDVKRILPLPFRINEVIDTMRAMRATWSGRPSSGSR